MPLKRRALRDDHGLPSGLAEVTRRPASSNGMEGLTGAFLRRRNRFGRLALYPIPGP